MPGSVRGYLAAIVLAMALLPIAKPAQAVSIAAQAPCVLTGDGVCMTFSDSSGAIPTVRGYTFNMPVVGSALVNFQGMVHCYNPTTIVSVIDLVGQIVPTETTAPSPTGPGGIHSAIVLPPYTNVPSATTYSLTMNFSTTRRFAYATTGAKTVFYGMARPSFRRCTLVGDIGGGVDHENCSARHRSR